MYIYISCSKHPSPGLRNPHRFPTVFFQNTPQAACRRSGSASSKRSAFQGSSLGVCIYIYYWYIYIYPKCRSTYRSIGSYRINDSYHLYNTCMIYMFVIICVYLYCCSHFSYSQLCLLSLGGVCIIYARISWFAHGKAKGLCDYVFFRREQLRLKAEVTSMPRKQWHVFFCFWRLPPDVSRLWVIYNQATSSYCIFANHWSPFSKRDPPGGIKI